MCALIMDYLGVEFMDLRNQSANIADLAKGLAEPGIVKAKKLYGVTQFALMRPEDLVGHDQQYVGVFG